MHNYLIRYHYWQANEANKTVEIMWCLFYNFFINIYSFFFVALLLFCYVLLLFFAYLYWILATPFSPARVIMYVMDLSNRSGVSCGP